MRTYVLGSLMAAVGAVAGFILMLVLKVGANTNCIDVIQQPGSAACAIPTAAPWAVALGAFIGAVLAVGATVLVKRQRR